MADEKIKVQIESTYDDGDAKQAIKDAEKIEKLDPELAIDADNSDAKSEIAEVTDDAEKLTGREWVAEFKADVAGMKADLQATERQLEEIDNTEVTPELDSSKIEQFGEDTGKAKDAMHGFVGEAVTGLPGIGPALGPASEAVGQITEGLLAGEVAMEGLVTAAIPIAAMVISIQAITSALERQKRIDAFNEQQVKDYTDALDGATDSAEALTEQLKDARKVTFVDAGGDVIDITENLKNLKLSAQDFAGFVADDKSFETWLAGVAKMRPELIPLIESIKEYGVQSLNAAQNVDRKIIPGAEDLARVMQAADQSQGNYAKAARDAAVANAVFGASVDNKVTAPLKDAKRASDDTRDALDDLRGALNFQGEADSLKEDLLGALNGVDQFGVQPTKEQIRQLKLDIIDVGDTAGKTDVEIETTLKMVDQGDYLTVLNTVQQWSKYNPILLATALAQPNNRIKNPVLGQPTPDGASVNGTAVTQQFTINVPRGYRELDAAQAAHRVSKRSGRIYARR